MTISTTTEEVKEINVKDKNGHDDKNAKEESDMLFRVRKSKYEHENA